MAPRRAVKLGTLLRLAILATSVAQIAGGDVMYGLFCLAALGFTR
jgi:hypothetical protein